MEYFYKNAKDWECPYCNQIFKGRRRLFSHLKECKEKEKLPKDSLGRTIRSESIEAIVKSARYRAENKLYKGIPCSESTKKKLSEIRKKALSEGRGNHWICPTIKLSYAEQYFYDIFSNANIKFENNVWICKRYCVDFLFGKYYFEVDGEQHYSEEGILHDKEREQYLLNNGYICIDRCRWKEFVKLDKFEKEKYVKEIFNKIAQYSNLAEGTDSNSV